MMRILFVVIAMLFTQVASAQTSVVVVKKGAQASLAWEFPVLTLASEKVVRFEIRVDTAAYVDAKLPMTGPSFIYALPTNLTDGLHVAAVRACNVTVCGLEASATFNIVAALPSTPLNPRIQSMGVIADLNIMVEYMNAYGWLLNGEKMAGDDMMDLIINYDGPTPITEGAWIQYLNLRAVDLIK